MPDRLWPHKGSPNCTCTNEEWEPQSDDCPHNHARHGCVPGCKGCEAGKTATHCTRCLQPLDTPGLCPGKPLDQLKLTNAPIPYELRAGPRGGPCPACEGPEPVAMDLEAVAGRWCPGCVDLVIACRTDMSQWMPFERAYPRLLKGLAARRQLRAELAARAAARAAGGACGHTQVDFTVYPFTCGGCGARFVEVG